jgi:hypothetical protein
MLRVVNDVLVRREGLTVKWSIFTSTVRQIKNR